MILMMLFIIVLLVIIGFLTYYVVRFANKIFELESSIESSLDILDECYGALVRISKYPVLYDDPVVQQAVREISKSRDSILVIANKLMIIDESLTNESKKERR